MLSVPYILGGYGGGDLHSLERGFTLSLILSFILTSSSWVKLRAHCR